MLTFCLTFSFFPANDILIYDRERTQKKCEFYPLLANFQFYAKYKMNCECLCFSSELILGLYFKYLYHDLPNNCLAVKVTFHVICILDKMHKTHLRRGTYCWVTGCWTKFYLPSLRVPPEKCLVNFACYDICNL